MSKKTLAEIKKEYRERKISYGKNTDKTPDEILKEITDSQLNHSVIKEAEYQCYMDNVVKILGKLGEYELATLVNRKLRKHILKLERESGMEIVEPAKAEKYYYWLPYWKGYLNRIPKRGLNNLTRKPSYGWGDMEWKGEPTLPRRLRGICVGGLFGNVKLPFFYYHMEMRTGGKEIENLPKIQELTKQIVERLEELYDNMDTVHILPEDKVEYWKGRIRETILYIRKQSRWVGLMLIQEVEVEVLDSPNEKQEGGEEGSK